MVSLGLSKLPLSRQLELFLIASVFYLDHLLYVTEAASMKYSHGPLVSALSARSTAATSEAAAAALESATDTGGEVVVPKTFPLSSQEPSCEQLRAMWIFSKRQSRAAEITNEIPTYRDPFAYNVWEPYYSTARLSSEGVRMLSRYGERSRSPVFGRVISREPLIPQRVTIGHRQRHYDVVGSNYGSSSPRLYGAESKLTSTSHVGAGGGSALRPSKYRYIGASGSAAKGANGGITDSVNVQGSFQRLKELIWTERAKELTQQRRAEEMAARAAVLKEIANGQYIQSSYKHPVKSDSPLMDENLSPDRHIYQHLNNGRMSIATGQSRYIENNYNNKKDSSYNNANNKNNNDYNNNNRRKNSNRVYKNKNNYESNGRTGNSKTSNNSGYSYASSPNSGGSVASSLRSYMNINKNRNIKNYGKQKYFPLLATDNGGSSVTTSQPSNYFEHEMSMGIPRAYMARPSHFRERNRGIFREDSPPEKTAETDYFSRESRSEPQQDILSKEAMLLERIIQDLNRNTSTSAISPVYMENYTNNKSLIEAEEAPATFADDIYTDDLDMFALPSMGKGVLSANVDEADDTFSIEEPLAKNVLGWSELDLADASAFLNYVKPHAGYPTKEAEEPLELYDYGTFY